MNTREQPFESCAAVRTLFLWCLLVIAMRGRSESRRYILRLAGVLFMLAVTTFNSPFLSLFLFLIYRLQWS